MKKTINVTRSSMPPYEEYCAEIKALWDTHWLTNMGIKHRTFESELLSFLNADHVKLFTNGHMALENILEAFSFPKGGEVITSPYTFASTTHAIVRCGLTPVMCDVKVSDYTIDCDRIEDLITEKTVAIMPIHVYGNLCDVENIKRIADKYSLKVIYDAAHSFAVKYKGISTAMFGDASAFSFHATKVFNSIEGGAVFFRDQVLESRLDAQKNFGYCNSDDVVYIGGNAKMNEFAAAMGICNIRHLNEEIGKRKMVAERYRQNLDGVKGISLNVVQQDVEPNYAYFPVIFDADVFLRDKIYEALKNESIVARKYFYPITNCLLCYKDSSFYGAEKTPIAKYLSDRVLTLPMYSDLSLDDVDRICDIIIKEIF